jgi:hypothetical protein
MTRPILIGLHPCGCDDPSPDARDSFIHLWNYINDKRGHDWDTNPGCG